MAQEPRISNTSFWESILVKATEQNDKLNRAVIVSVVLHFILIALLIWGSLQEKVDMGAGGGGDGTVVGAVMVDPGAVVEQYNRQQQQSNDAQRAEKQRQKRGAGGRPRTLCYVAGKPCGLPHNNGPAKNLQN